MVAGGAPPVNRGEGEGNLAGSMRGVKMARECVSDQRLATEIDGQGAGGQHGPEHIEETSRSCWDSRGGLERRSALVLTVVDGINWLIN